MISETVVSLLPLTLVLAHLSDAYLRYLAFKNRRRVSKMTTFG